MNRDTSLMSPTSLSTASLVKQRQLLNPVMNPKKSLSKEVKKEKKEIEVK